MMDMCCRLGYSHLPGSAWEMSNSQAFLVTDDWRVMACLPSPSLSVQEREKGGFKAEVEEEFEDTEGNVYNKKTFEDLRRQGLI